MGHDHHHHLPVDHLNRAFVLGIVLNLVFVASSSGPDFGSTRSR